MTSVEEAIRQAEQVLPGSEAPEGAIDPRWQAIIAVGAFVETAPQPIWEFVCRWAEHADDDLAMALGTCLLEHLLEHHFATYFPKVEEACAASQRFAQVFITCSRFGQAEEDENARRFNRLEQRCKGAGER